MWINSAMQDMSHTAIHCNCIVLFYPGPAPPALSDHAEEDEIKIRKFEIVILMWLRGSISLISCLFFAHMQNLFRLVVHLAFKNKMFEKLLFAAFT